MKLYYIENAASERHSLINGYFSTYEKAQEELKDCCDWYRSSGWRNMDMWHQRKYLLEALLSGVYLS
jgi:hypothetical protein